MKHTPIAPEAEIDRMGQYLAGQLSLATVDIPHDISERLRVARQQALVRRKPVAQLRRLQENQLNSNGTLTASGDEGLSLWSILASALPLLALVAGLLIIQSTKDENIALEIAATDSALLTDELPPHAYTDAGFAQYLKLNHSPSGQHD
jgi:hypothetical protein